MPRRLFPLLSTLSLLLCLATLLLWARSHFVADLLTKQTEHTAFAIRSDRGTIRLRHCNGFPSTTDHSLEWRTAHPMDPPDNFPSWIHRLGFGFDRSRDFVGPAGPIPPGVHFSPLIIWVSEWWLPHWFLASLTSILPLLTLFRRYRHHHRLKHNLCPTCAYDLRASKDKCPECGSPIPSLLNPGEDAVQSSS